MGGYPVKQVGNREGWLSGLCTGQHGANHVHVIFYHRLRANSIVP